LLEEEPQVCLVESDGQGRIVRAAHVAPVAHIAHIGHGERLRILDSPAVPPTLGA